MSWNPTKQIPTSSVRIVVAGLRALGHPVTDPAEPSMPIADVGALLHRAIAVGGPAFGIRAGLSIPHGALGLVDHLCAAAPTGRDMLADLARYMALVSSGVTLRLDGSSVVLLVPDAFPTPHRRLLAELLFSLLDARMADRGQQSAVVVDFPWAVPDAAAETMERWSDVRFGAPDCRMTFAADALAAPLRTADNSLRRLLDAYATQELAAHPGVETTAHRVRLALQAALPGGPPSAAQAAQTLGMSARSLRRALAVEGTRFSDVRDATLRAVAEDALGDPERSIGEVAWLLGYSEPSAFHRAFRRWTGSTPEAHRRRGRGGQ